METSALPKETTPIFVDPSQAFDLQILKALVSGSGKPADSDQIGQSAPYEGYSKNVDVESVLHNSFHPTQKCVQSKYIPNSRSDMYNANYLIPASNPVRMTNNLLFKKTQFNAFNPNQCNLGYKVFNNHIRVQTKNIKLTSENTEEPVENK